jgi:hypothetical protein
MVDTRISDLTDGVTAQGTDEIPAARAGSNVKLRVSQLLDGVTRTLRVYDDGVDFTAGVSSTLALPVDAVVEDNLEVYFNGLFQSSTEWTITTGGSPSVNFTSPIPSFVGRVEVRILSKT